MPAGRLRVKEALQVAVADGARERKHVADVGDAGQIHDAALKTEAEARVSCRAVFAKVEIELIVLPCPSRGLRSRC